ncbi:MAG: LytR/AlgR family response regulator transcription factor [Bacteroidia bacterium]
MIKCILIDDEPNARKLLQAIIQDYCPELELLASCSDLPEGVKAIRKYNPMIVFLDIEMPGHSGLELLDFFDENEISFNIVFTTAYSEYALQAFRFSAIDYLLKPIQHQQLIATVKRYEKLEKRNSGKQLEILRENLEPRTDWLEKKIAVPSAQTIHFLKPNDIILIKGDSAYSDFYLSDGRKLTASRNLRHFEEMLKNIPTFFRSHKSYIINRNKVLEYVKSDCGYLMMEQQLIASISGDKVSAFLEGM